MIPFEQTQKDVAEVKRDLKELRTLIENGVKSNPTIETPFGIKELENLTGYTKPTLYSYCQKNIIPHHKKNGRLFFFKSEIIDWIKQGKQKTVTEVDSDVDVLLSNKSISI